MQYRLKRDGLPDLQFDGRLLHEVTSDVNRVHSGPGGNGLWTDLALYETESGKRVVQEIGRTNLPWHHTRWAAIVCEGDDEIVSALLRDGKLGWLSKALLAKAGIDVVETI